MKSTEFLKDIRYLLKLLDHSKWTSDNSFTAVFRKGRIVLTEAGLTDSQFADMLLVSSPTVKRWVEGESLPHPAMRPSIMECIKEQALGHLNRLEKIEQEAGQ